MALTGIRLTAALTANVRQIRSPDEANAYTDVGDRAPKVGAFRLCRSNCRAESGDVGFSRVVGPAGLHPGYSGLYRGLDKRVQNRSPDEA